MEQATSKGTRQPGAPARKGAASGDQPADFSAAEPRSTQAENTHTGSTQDGAAQPEATERMAGQTGVRFRVPGWLIAGAVYLLGSVAIWWPVWRGHLTSAMTCGCGDPASFVWFLAWPKYAITHGHSLFFSARAHVPGGINLLDNTSVLALGVPLAPVTWLFGPITSLNISLTAAPALTGLATYACLRRALGLGWPASFLGGLLFGFSPFMMRNEAANHLQTSFLALLPLMFWCCYELAVTQRGKWWRWGLFLGLLVTVQYFLGTDILTITVITTVLALTLTALAMLFSRRELLAAKFPFAWRGFGLAAAVAGVLLAYPVWFTMAGPGHIKGANYFNPALDGLGQVLFPVGPSSFNVQLWAREGYLGRIGTVEAYLGIPALLILVVAVILLRRPLAMLCAAVTAIAVWLTLGPAGRPLVKGGNLPGLPLPPWKFLERFPVLDKLTPATFSAPAVWFVMIAGVLLVEALLRAPTAGDLPGAHGSASTELRVYPNARVPVAVVASIALAVPWLLAWPVPFSASPVRPPAWVANASTHLPSNAVVLFYPFPSTFKDAGVLWQAQYGMRYSIVGGRGIVAGKGNVANHGWTPGTPEGTMTALSVRWEPHYPSLKLPPFPDAVSLRSFRDDLRHWKVTDVVMLGGGRNPHYALRWLTAMLGMAPQQQDGAWVWHNVQKLIS